MKTILFQLPSKEKTYRRTPVFLGKYMLDSGETPSPDKENQLPQGGMHGAEDHG